MASTDLDVLMIEARAALITSSRLQRSFREKVVENARTLTLRGEWLDDDPPGDDIRVRMPQPPIPN